MESVNKPKLVAVQWYDAEVDLGWKDQDEISVKPPLVYTIGFLVAEGDEAIVVASTVGYEGTESNARILIPLGMIKDVKEFNVPPTD